MRLEYAGEAALIAYLGDRSSPQVAAQVQALGAELKRLLDDQLVDLIPSYASLLICFDPLQTDHYHVSETARRCLAQLTVQTVSTGRVIEIPVYYHPEAGADLETLAADRGLTWQDVAELHSIQEYRVYAIGFAPGFAYLGDVDERIAAPRQKTPRRRVPRGAVAIADRQSAVYPAESPGGWNLLGRSPLRMFDPTAEPPMPVSVGDRVRFTPIDRDAFLDAGGTLA